MLIPPQSRLPMSTAVRSYSKINLGLAIGRPRSDGFHALSTLYQTVALHDRLTVSARQAAETRIVLTSSHPRVPLDNRNTVWKMVERALAAARLTAEVEIHIQKNLPIQGGMGAGSANAAAALLGLERELELNLAPETRLRVAAEVGSDVPLFLIGGSVLGFDRGQNVRAVEDVVLAGSAQIPCVIALPSRGVSTPQAFRDWDARFTDGPDLHNPPVRDTLEELSRTYASVFTPKTESGASGIFSDPSSKVQTWNSPEKLHGLSREQHHPPDVFKDGPGTSGSRNNLAESLLALVHAGIENDFESVVFLQYPLLREIKRQLMGTSDLRASAAVYAALSGSGSALFRPLPVAGRRKRRSTKASATRRSGHRHDDSAPPSVLEQHVRRVRFPGTLGNWKLLLGDRLTVGQEPLKLSVQVRILVAQPSPSLQVHPATHAVKEAEQGD